MKKTHVFANDVANNQFEKDNVDLGCLLDAMNSYDVRIRFHSRNDASYFTVLQNLFHAVPVLTENPYFPFVVVAFIASALLTILFSYAALTFSIWFFFPAIAFFLCLVGGSAYSFLYLVGKKKELSQIMADTETSEEPDEKEIPTIDSDDNEDEYFDIRKAQRINLLTAMEENMKRASSFHFDTRRKDEAVKGVSDNGFPCDGEAALYEQNGMIYGENIFITLDCILPKYTMRTFMSPAKHYVKHDNATYVRSGTYELPYRQLYPLSAFFILYEAGRNDILIDFPTATIVFPEHIKKWLANRCDIPTSVTDTEL